MNERSDLVSVRAGLHTWVSWRLAQSLNVSRACVKTQLAWHILISEPEWVASSAWLTPLPFVTWKTSRSFCRSQLRCVTFSRNPNPMHLSFILVYMLPEGRDLVVRCSFVPLFQSPTQWAGTVKVLKLLNYLILYDLHKQAWGWPWEILVENGLLCKYFSTFLWFPRALAST